MRAPSGLVTVASTDVGMSLFTIVKSALSTVQTAGNEGSVTVRVSPVATNCSIVKAADAVDEEDELGTPA